MYICFFNDLFYSLELNVVDEVAEGEEFSKHNICVCRLYGIKGGGSF